MVEHVASILDLGDTRAELTAFVDRAVKVLRSTLMGRVMQGLVSELASNPELARAFREQVVAVRVAEIRRLVEKGIARGQRRPDADYELANELLFGQPVMQCAVAETLRRFSDRPGSWLWFA
jgi:hypothetical protein